LLAVGPVTAEGHLEIVPLPVYSPPAQKAVALARDSDHVPLKDKTAASKVPAVPSSGFDRLQLSLRSFLVLRGLTPLEEDDESRAARERAAEERQAEDALLAAEQDRARAQAALRRNQAGTLVTLIQVAEGLYVAPPNVDIVV